MRKPISYFIVECRVFEKGPLFSSRKGRKIATSKLGQPYSFLVAQRLSLQSTAVHLLC